MPSASSSEGSLVGTTLAGRYHLVRLLGDGGMGAVYKAADTVLRRFVAIKLLHRSVAQNPKAVERFEREARAAAAIGHPNIIEVLDFVVAEGTSFLVMEYLKGRSLAHLLGSEGPLPIARACRIAAHTLAGLDAAHARGILHRDLKPANLMLVAHLGDRDFVKICDFGFAALLAPEDRIDDGVRTLTPARTLVGTPAYAAPERLRGEDRRDPRIDVWSVGVVLFEMLAGVRPFDGPSFAELARAIREDAPLPLRRLRPDVPPGLERVVERALSKDPDARWASAEQFAAALVPFGGRMVPAEDDSPSDSFTMDLIKVRARQTQRRARLSSTGTEALPRAADRTAPQRPLTAAQAAALVGTPPPPEATSVEIPIEVAADDVRTPSATGPGLDASPSDVRTSKYRRLPALADEEAAARRPRTEPAPPPDVAGRETLPSGTPALVAPSGVQRRYASSAVLAVLRFVSTRFGERALARVLSGLAPEHRAVFMAGIAPGQWVDAEAVSALVEGIDAVLGHDDLRLVVECGRAVAEAHFERMRAIAPPQGPTPELLLAEMPALARELVQGLDYAVRRLGRGYARVELAHEWDEVPLTHLMAAVGFLHRSLERFGAAEVEVVLLSARALGDERTVFDLSWLP
ncbi:MAG: protein kinase [Myxococcota bacterium]|nr:protein kinase [Myxococcota bacterium]